MPLRVQRTLTVVFLFVFGISCQITSVDSSKFIGYYVAEDSVEPLFAANAWVTSGSYAGDCNSSGRCPIATRCEKNMLYYDDDSIFTCAGASCVEATIYATSPAGLPSAVNYACRSYWNAHTIYRELPATAKPMTTPAGTVQPLPPNPTSTEAGVRTIFISIPATATTSNTTAASNTNAATAPTATPPQASGQDKSWIAGIVIGPVFAVALVAAAVWIWRRRKAAGEKGKPVELDGQSDNHWQGYPHYQQYHEKDCDGQVIELPSSRPPAELDTNGSR